MNHTRITPPTPDIWAEYLDAIDKGVVRIETMSLAEFHRRYPRDIRTPAQPPDIGSDVPGGGAV
jgi:hypothetical protein